MLRHCTYLVLVCNLERVFDIFIVRVQTAKAESNRLFHGISLAYVHCLGSSKRLRLVSSDSHWLP